MFDYLQHIFKTLARRFKYVQNIGLAYQHDEFQVCYILIMFNKILSKPHVCVGNRNLDFVLVLCDLSENKIKLKIIKSFNRSRVDRSSKHPVGGPARSGFQWDYSGCKGLHYFISDSLEDCSV